MMPATAPEKIPDPPFYILLRVTCRGCGKYMGKLLGAVHADAVCLACSGVKWTYCLDCARFTLSLKDGGCPSCGSKNLREG